MKRIFTILSVLVLSISALFAQTDTLAMWTFPTTSFSDTLPDFHNEMNVNSYVFAEGTSAILMKNGATTQAVQATDWQDGANTKSWQLKASTTAYGDLALSVKLTAGGSNPGPRDFKTQYKIGTSGTWTDVAGGSLTVMNDWTTGVLSNLDLPIECENVSELFVRFVMTSDTAQNGSIVVSSGTSKIDDVLITGTVLSSVNKVKNDYSLVVFPNPTKGIFYVESNENIESIKIYSLTGQLVFSKNASTNKEQINSNLTKGLYFVQTQDINKIVKITKLIVQ
ncbi:MAG TPA: hypothetical protein DDX39_00040 [Bacteroidales bacterium]|nr:MAG: hypothetical protein A2W98_05245 [Bacteroidetes bacterium GWF2_33_38]OFY75375.1 MAG: hypothetical protein A2265_06470 [Bacteroidetes bacterium RIFOXYA12_FULL_33_9]OFY92172.1 MAG: hypothetical protein A2236_11915 [Bacteroidetes bacterium RIFOXYA2_FULL_33_7]HBF86999.1 hypothetical protein [Bacteroidales bacterium]